DRGGCKAAALRKMRPPVLASRPAEVKSGVCRATPVRRQAASSTSAAAGKVNGVSTALISRNGNAAIATQARPIELAAFVPDTARLRSLVEADVDEAACRLKIGRA